MLDEVWGGQQPALSGGCGSAGDDAAAARLRSGHYPVTTDVALGGRSLCGAEVAGLRSAQRSALRRHLRSQSLHALAASLRARWAGGFLALRHLAGEEPCGGPAGAAAAKPLAALLHGRRARGRAIRPWADSLLTLAAAEEALGRPASAAAALRGVLRLDASAAAAVPAESLLVRPHVLYDLGLAEMRAGQHRAAAATMLDAAGAVLGLDARPPPPAAGRDAMGPEARRRWRVRCLDARHCALDGAGEVWRRGGDGGGALVPTAAGRLALLAVFDECPAFRAAVAEAAAPRGAALVSFALVRAGGEPRLAAAVFPGGAGPPRAFRVARSAADGYDVVETAPGGGAGGAAAAGPPVAAAAAPSPPAAVAEAEGRVDVLPPLPQPTCASCGARRGAGVALRRCGACLGPLFCGPACQKAHWPAHRDACRAAAAQRAAQAAAAAQAA